MSTCALGVCRRVYCLTDACRLTFICYGLLNRVCCTYYVLLAIVDLSLGNDASINDCRVCGFESVERKKDLMITACSSKSR